MPGSVKKNTEKKTFKAKPAIQDQEYYLINLINESLFKRKINQINNLQIGQGSEDYLDENS